MNLSVIIPVYNCEHFIDKCILSLLNQSYQDYEIVIVDDGSTDTSLLKVKTLLAEWGNRIIISLENGGVSRARNVGIQCAKGEWIAFIDSDDFLAPDYLEKMMKANSGCDLVISGMFFMNGDIENHHVFPPEDVWTIDDLRQDKASYLDYTTSACGRVYRKEIIDNNNIQFDETMITAEDRDFNIEYISKAEKIRFIHYAGYYYQTTHEGSLSKAFLCEGLHREILYWNKMYRLLEGTNENYLAHRLYYFITDTTSKLLQRKDFSDAFHALREVRPLFDRSFLRRNLKSIKAPAWQKALVRIYLG